jgi:hypothetical protein
LGGLLFSDIICAAIALKISAIEHGKRIAVGESQIGFARQCGRLQSANGATRRQTPASDPPKLVID